MRDLWLSPVHKYRIVHPTLGVGDETCGSFSIPSPIDQQQLFVIASCGAGWDHVSVSRKKRTPNWPELEFVRKLFFREGETVMQLHVPESEHVNLHENCLHLWRPQDQPIPTPPSWMVGPRAGESMDDVVAASVASIPES